MEILLQAGYISQSSKGPDSAHFNGCDNLNFVLFIYHNLVDLGIEPVSHNRNVGNLYDKPWLIHCFINQLKYLW